MKASYRADLTTLYKKMHAAAQTFHQSACAIGVEGLVDYANRVVVFVERCKAMLEDGIDFASEAPPNDLLRRITEAEQALEDTRRELAETRVMRQLFATNEDFQIRVEAFERAAYARVQADMTALRIWPALESGDWITPARDGTLLGAMNLLRAHRHALANPPRRAEPPPPAVTHHPQDFRVAAADGPESLPPPSGVPSFPVPPPGGDLEPSGPQIDLSGDDKEGLRRMVEQNARILAEEDPEEP